MSQIVGYLVKKDREIIGVTSNERDAMYIARTREAISYRVVTTIDPKADPATELTVAYDGTI